MPDPVEPAPSPSALAAAYPQLFVTDMAAACAFFERRLRFTVVFLHGEPPFHGQVLRDGVRLNLRHVDDPVFDRERREREHLLSAYIPVDDVDALFAEFTAAGAPFHQKLSMQPWGVRDFVVRDPDGNLLLFADR